MLWGVRSYHTRLLAVLAISLHVLLQGALAVGPSHGFDVTRLYCASPDTPRSAEVTAALRELAVLAGLETPFEEPDPEHCPFCVLVHGAHFQPQPRLTPPIEALRRSTCMVFEPAFQTLAQGPPLGPRAPPAHL